MAVAHTSGEFGSADHELKVVSPVVTQLTMPRFLSMGDKSRLMLDVHNLTKTKQDLDILLDAGPPIKIIGETRYEIILEPNEKKSITVPIFAKQSLGRSDITCTINGLRLLGESKDRQIKRSWFIETRPPYPAITKVWHKQLAPGISFKIDSVDTASLINETIGVKAGISTFVPINISEHLSRLEAYPYGCLEQTVSGLFPHVILSSSDFADLGLTTGTDKEKADKVRLGIQRLMEKQRTSGGFGLWSSKDPESSWLTAYAAHFLINASQAGYQVSENSLQRALQRLMVYVKRAGSIPRDHYYPAKPYKGAVRAYAAFVLAKVQSLTLGDARSMYQSIAKDLQGSLAHVHAGLALFLAGDKITAEKAFETAIKKRRSHGVYVGDYGSDLRDFAMASYLLSVYYPDFSNRVAFQVELESELRKKEWLSTQERNSLVMAGAARLNTKSASWNASVNAGETKINLDENQQKQMIFSKGKAAKGFEITNTGETDIYINVTLVGYPQQKPKLLESGVKIQRRYLDLNGRPLETMSFASGDRILVEFQFFAEQRMPHCLVVNLLPAGIELEDPNLSGSTIIGDIMVDKKSVASWHQAYDIRHTEYRDDRFAAALNIGKKEWYRLFYPARVVSPGSFVVPPPMIEDMYAPHIRGIGDSALLMEITLP